MIFNIQLEIEIFHTIIIKAKIEGLCESEIIIRESYLRPIIFVKIKYKSSILTSIEG